MERADKEGEARQGGSIIAQCLTTRNFAWSKLWEENLDENMMNKNNWDEKCVMPNHVGKPGHHALREAIHF